MALNFNPEGFVDNPSALELKNRKVTKEYIARNHGIKLIKDVHKNALVFFIF